MRNPSNLPPAHRSIFAGAALLALSGHITRAGAADDAAPREIRGVVLDSDNHPVPAATIVAGSLEAGRPGHQVLTTDGEGRFACTWPVGSGQISLIVHKEGFTASERTIFDPPRVDPRNVSIKLGEPAPFTATLIDADGRPVGGAKVRVETRARAVAFGDGKNSSISTSYMRFPNQVIEHSPLEGIFVATTDAGGSFTFKAFPAGSGLKLWVTGPDGRSLRVGTVTLGPDGRVIPLHLQTARMDLARRTLLGHGVVTAPAGEVTHLEAIPAARIVGKIVSTLPGVDVAGLTVRFQESHPPQLERLVGNEGAETVTDAEGRFTFDGLNEGNVNVFAHGAGENKDWTYRAAQDVGLVPGETTPVTLQLIRGVEVEGAVIVQGTGAPVAGAQVGVHGPFRPRTGAMTTGVMTDARGHYRFRLPDGETYFYVMGPPGRLQSIAPMTGRAGPSPSPRGWSGSSCRRSSWAIPRRRGGAGARDREGSQVKPTRCRGGKSADDWPRTLAHPVGQSDDFQT